MRIGGRLRARLDVILEDYKGELTMIERHQIRDRFLSALEDCVRQVPAATLNAPVLDELLGDKSSTTTHICGNPDCSICHARDVRESKGSGDKQLDRMIHYDYPTRCPNCLTIDGQHADGCVIAEKYCKGG